MASAHDKAGRYVVLRVGTKTDNYVKISTKYNITNPGVWKFVVRATGGHKGSGTERNYYATALHFECDGHGICWVDKSESLKLVQEFRKNSARYPGKQYGVVTMLCEGKTKCPAWVNTAINASQARKMRAAARTGSLSLLAPPNP